MTFSLILEKYKQEYPIALWFDDAIYMSIFF